MSNENAPREALVEKLAATGKATLYSRTIHIGGDMNTEYRETVKQVHEAIYKLDDDDILAHPIVQRLLSDRAATVAEPDAETVAVRDLGSVLRLEYARGYGDAKREQQFNVVSSTTYQPIAAMPSGKDAEWLDEALDSVPGMYLDHLHDGKRGPSSPNWYEEPVPDKRWTARVIVRQGQAGPAGYWITDYFGFGPNRKAAVLDAVQKAKEASGE